MLLKGSGHLKHVYRKGNVKDGVMAVYSTSGFSVQRCCHPLSHRASGQVCHRQLAARMRTQQRSLRWEKATALLREDDSHAGLPWRPGGHDSVLPSQGEWVRSLVEELRSRKLDRVARARARWRPLRIGRKQGLRVGGARDRNRPLGFPGNGGGGSALRRSRERRVELLI